MHKVMSIKERRPCSAQVIHIDEGHDWSSSAEWQTDHAVVKSSSCVER